ncbi:MAG: transcriptional regulator, DeoR family [Bacillota bacterium]|jgi:DeoR/GlpR family transcriptional regulator of sugar metabolism|nr:transcriptional regulator, DeoR family [Bacillota bacterium]
MQTFKNKTELRHEKIRSMLIAADLVTVAEFRKNLNCSEATIRNDLRYLEEKGLLKRCYGGAVATGSTARHMNMNMRSVAYKKEKEAIAQHIVKSVLISGQTIILDSGSTSLEIAQRIVESELELTVLTNSFAIATILTHSSHVKFFLAGGSYDPEPGAFHDEFSIALFNTMRADICFLSVNGVSCDAGFTISGFEEASIKQAMIKASRQCYVIADHSKLGKTGLKVICDLSDVTALISNKHDHDEIVKELEASGLKIILAPLKDQ